MSPILRSTRRDDARKDGSPLLRALFVLLYFAGVRPPPVLGHPPDAVEPSRARPAPRARAASLAAQDWLVLGYLGVLLAAVVAGGGPRRAAAAGWVCVDLAFWLVVLALTRSAILASKPRLAGVLYRAALPVPAIASFAQLHDVLSTAAARTVDAKLYAIDVALFGYEPALAWDRLVTPALTEWFAFFYYGYFFLIAAHMIPMLFVRKDTPLLTRFSFGFLWVYCVGQALYLVVPAYGPHVLFEGRFAHALDGSTFWPLVRHTVGLGGARTDVFPSLHTAVPTYLSLFSFVHRRQRPFRLTWAPLALFTSQIILATMYLRWHYLVDVVAGLVLAASAIAASNVAVHRELANARRGGAPVWPGLAGA